MVFYALLLENSTKDAWHMREAMIDFVEAEAKGERAHKVFVPTEEDKQHVRAQVQEVYERIQRMEFPGCHRSDCRWCNMFSC